MPGQLARHTTEGGDAGQGKDKLLVGNESIKIRRCLSWSAPGFLGLTTRAGRISVKG